MAEPDFCELIDELFELDPGTATSLTVLKEIPSWSSLTKLPRAASKRAGKVVRLLRARLDDRTSDCPDSGTTSPFPSAHRQRQRVE